MIELSGRQRPNLPDSECASPQPICLARRSLKVGQGYVARREICGCDGAKSTGVRRWLRKYTLAMLGAKLASFPHVNFRNPCSDSPSR
jgi:hypothetical protein